MMNKEQKQNYIKEMAAQFEASEAVLVAHYQGLTVKQLDELSKEIANLDNININVEYVMDRMVKLSAANTKLANLLDKMHDRVIELEKWRGINESLYSNG